MTRTFLVRGMLVGIVAGLIAFAFARAFGEPQINRAIAFEERMDAAKAEKAKAEAAKAGKPYVEEAEPELVSRAVQSSVGLLTAVVVLGAAFGGLFGIAFAFARGRLGRLGPRATAALLAGAGYLSIYLVPALKYPPNPPSVGDPETIGYRTALFFAMMVISVAALGFAVTLARRLMATHGRWNAVLLASAAFIVIVAVCQFVMPSVDEVPEAFSAVVLWRFRVASFGTQLILWTVIGLAFGALTERGLVRERSRAAVGQAAPPPLPRRG
jgi:predicted cobalt transporter CbtA